MRRTLPLLLIAALFLPAPPSEGADLLVEAESFAEHGGWKLDTQFIQQMGSPYLLAHGLGKPVADASTTLSVSNQGKYRVWVRTKDWVARWDAKPSPGRFKLSVNGKALDETFGTKGAEWSWHDGGVVELASGENTLRLIDETGFDGRCDCIYFTSDLEQAPPPADKVLSSWRRDKLGLPAEPVTKGPYDLVVIGGGYAGMGSAISAARMGCNVALVQDRGVLGGNGSSEVRVWAMGNIRRGKYPRIGEIIEEFCDHASKSPGTYEEFGDALKEQVVRAEGNIDLMLNHHAFAVEMDGSKIAAVKALNTRTAEEVRIQGNLFADCTGHAWVGSWAGADSDMTAKGRMGMSNMWAWGEGEETVAFPETPWALDLKMADFPYPRDHHGQWFWESGYDKDALGDAEGIRDWNLRAVYGAFNAMKNRDGAADHKTAELTWVAYVGGPRESRRLMGDVVLTEEDIVNKRDFPDGCVPSTWSIDLHYPKEQYKHSYPDNPFISIAIHNRNVDRMYGYPVPYRCFYSRNIENLFMAGRCASVTHEALGTVRVMKTCGMMGEVVGKAASLCTLHDCQPRDIYEAHLDELIELLHLPGKARRTTPSDKIVIPDDAMELAGSHGPMTGKRPKDLDGIVIDDRGAKLTGTWSGGTGLKNYVGYGYRYASAGSDATATFKFKVNDGGRYNVRLYSQAHENRAKSAPVAITVGNKTTKHRVDQQTPSPGDVIDVTEIEVPTGGQVDVVISCDDAGGTVHVDAVGLVKVQ